MSYLLPVIAAIVAPMVADWSTFFTSPIDSEVYFVNLRQQNGMLAGIGLYYSLQRDRLEKTINLKQQDISVGVCFALKRQLYFIVEFRTTLKNSLWLFKLRIAA